MSNNWLQDATEPIRNSQLLRVLLIGFLILLLQIPIVMIDGVIGEREETRDNGVREVTSSWGGNQSIAGPWITVPYLHHWTELRTTGSQVEDFTRTETRYATFLPETLRITGRTASEVRSRGIFQVPLYTLSLEVELAAVPVEDSLVSDALGVRNAERQVGLLPQNVLGTGSPCREIRPGEATAHFKG